MDIDAIIKAVKDWPVIIQALFAAGLYSALVKVAQISSTFARDQLAKISATQRYLLGRTELVREQSLEHYGTGEGAHYQALLLARALRYVITGLLWLALGFLSSRFIAPFEIVGYLGFIFYLLIAWHALRVSPPKTPEERTAAIQHLEDELSELRRKHKIDR